MDGEVDYLGKVFKAAGCNFFILHHQRSAYVDRDLDSQHGRAQEKVEEGGLDIERNMIYSVWYVFLFGE